MPAYTLAYILANIVQYSRDDYFNGKETTYPADIGWNAAYICACFLANHTRDGESGVDTEVPHVGLKIMEEMSFDDRLKLAQALIKEWGGPI